MRLLKCEMRFRVDLFTFIVFSFSSFSLASLKHDTDQAANYALTIKQNSNYPPLSQAFF